MAYLVDTDVLVDVAKNNQGAIDFLDSLKDFWSVSVITTMELLVGARDKRDVEKIDELISSFSTDPLSPPIGTRAYRLLKQFSRSHGLRVFDSLIAATAIENDRTLMTRNEKHFRMIPDLKLQIPQY